MVNFSVYKTPLVVSKTMLRRVRVGAGGEEYNETPVGIVKMRFNS